MGDYIVLERRTEPFVRDDCKFDNLFDALKGYGIPELRKYIVDHYSKLDAIDRHTGDLTLDMARALLTDREVLFAQTRERSFPTIHSRRLLDSTHYGERPDKTDLRLNEDNFDDFVASVRKKYTPVLVEVTSRKWLGTRFNIFDLMLRTVLSMCRALDHIASKLYQPSEDPGYVKGASTEEQKAWMETVMLRFPKRKPVAAAKWLEKHVKYPISDKEMFLFLAYILPDAVCEAKKRNKSHRLYQAAGRKPPAAITFQQREKLNKQIEDFHQRDYTDVLPPWKGAGDLLSSYYSSDTEKYSNIIMDDAMDFDGLEECTKLFSNSFENYFRVINPTSNKSVQKREEKLSSNLATFLLSITSDNQRPLLIDQPLTIYRIARSPVHRNICKESNLDKIIHILQCCNTDFSFPVFQKLLDAELDLYSDIVDACAIGCKHFQINFDKKSWSNLWQCIVQSIECLSYGYDDLLSVPLLFKFGYPEFRPFFLVLDQWLRSKLSDADAPFEPVLWRGIYNSLIKTEKDGTDDKVDYVEDFLIPYRKMFTSTTPDNDELLNLLNSLAGRFRWNYVTCKPTVEELIQAKKNSPIKHEKISEEQIESYTKIIWQVLRREHVASAYNSRLSRKRRKYACLRKKRRKSRKYSHFSVTILQKSKKNRTLSASIRDGGLNQAQKYRIIYRKKPFLFLRKNHFNPSHNELMAAERFLRKKAIDDSPIHRKIKDIQLVMTEWILLQQLCYQTQFNLFRAIDKAINGNCERTGQ